MMTDEEKSKIAKLLQDVAIKENQLPERCSELVEHIREKYESELRCEDEEHVETYVNPYVVDKLQLEEIDRKLVLAKTKRQNVSTRDVTIQDSDPTRPWRTNSNKEKLFRIDNELKRHLDQATDMIDPLSDGDMSDIIKQCREETKVSNSIEPKRLSDTVEEAKKTLLNFQYKALCNTTATAILPEAHTPDPQSSGQFIPRPETRRCFLRSLGSLKELRMLALEYSHIGDGTGGALISLLPILKRPHFHFQLICREEHIPGHTDAADGVGGYGIPDTAWRKVAIACPDLYMFMAFDRIWEYDHVRNFLTPSIPLHETHLHLGIHVKLEQRQDSDLSCFVRYIAFHYASTLVTLGIHQWRGTTFPLRRIFELMPRLVRFYYLGKVNEKDLHSTLNMVACGIYEKLKRISIQIQSEKSTVDHWRQVVTKIMEDYSDIMRLTNIDFCIQLYKY